MVQAVSTQLSRPTSGTGKPPLGNPSGGYSLLRSDSTDSASSNSSSQSSPGLDEPNGLPRSRQRLFAIGAVLTLALVVTLVGNSRSATLDPAVAGQAEFTCNPFAELGRLQVDLDNLTANVCQPFERTCHPSAYMNSFVGNPSHNQLHWFRNRTILLQGDSIERFHLGDFCDSTHEPVIAEDGLETAESAERDRLRRENEAFWEGRPIEGIQLTNPWVCDVAEYGTTLISVFTWGLHGDADALGTEYWYYPPASWVERLSAITKPLLAGLARHMERPQIEYPDPISLNSGYWDLRKWTEEDFFAEGHTERPYLEESSIPFTPLSPEREEWWAAEARRVLQSVARQFADEASGRARDGPAIVWRTLHHPPRNNHAPFPRVEALNPLSRHVIEQLQTESRSTRLSLLQRLAGQRRPAEDLGLDERLRVDHSGERLIGFEHLFRDTLHPMAVPGSWMWSNVMLYE